MSVISTNSWLLDSLESPLDLCEKLTDSFEGASAEEIYQYLIRHGMYQRPLNNGVDTIKQLQRNNVWKVVEEQEERLKQLWNGPDIPIYIFPSEQGNRVLHRHFNGKSGVAFIDKLFLFVSEYNSEDEIKALFTHEYNHVCRLTKYEKDEQDYDLLDTIILEGLAEDAVFEQLGEKHLANWTSYYSDEQLDRMWRRHIYGARNLPRGHRRHQALLYGLRLYPRMGGYCVGYYLVKKYRHESELTSKELLALPSSEIAQIRPKEAERI